MFLKNENIVLRNYNENNKKKTQEENCAKKGHCESQLKTDIVIVNLY